MTAQSPDRPLILVLAPGYEAYRRYHLESLRTRYRVHLVADVGVDWAATLVEGQTLVADYRPETVLDALRAADIAGAAQGLIAWDEGKIAAAARIADVLGLPGPSPAAVDAVRDKSRTRLALAHAGVPQPGFALADSAESAARDVAVRGFPVVVKPRGGAASYGVTVVEERDHLGPAVERALAVEFGAGDVPTASVLVEEFVDGPEISIDCAIERGVLTMVCIGRKQLGFPPMCEEVGHVVNAADPLLQDGALHAMLTRAHHAVGFDHGWTHTEVKLTSDGPRLIEINGRLGGDLIPRLAALATGIDPSLAAAALATGAPPDLQAREQRAAAVRFLYPPDRLVGRRVTRASFDLPDTDRPWSSGIEGTDVDPPPQWSGVERAVVLVAEGDRVPPPSGGIPERVGFVVAVGDDLERCEAALDRAEQSFHLECESGAG